MPACSAVGVPSPSRPAQKEEKVPAVPRVTAAWAQEADTLVNEPAAPSSPGASRAGARDPGQRHGGGHVGGRDRGPRSGRGGEDLTMTAADNHEEDSCQA